MNAIDRNMDELALLHYGDGEYAVLKPGRYVLCAVSAQRVPLDQLKYWNVERQEAYAGAREALAGFSTPSLSKDSKPS